ncbi:Uncharacterised protein [Yersinia thracica]|uniref:Uncharacterized protein n=1 Tax=Yersinia thracica TaxID=2890319 RepID=A0A0T9NB38_9GAMM|nr:Uncharacterised protein [Yersinia thracica]
MSREVLTTEPDQLITELMSTESDHRTPNTEQPNLITKAKPKPLSPLHINNKTVTSITHKCFFLVKSWLVCWFLITIMSENEH